MLGCGGTEVARLLRRRGALDGGAGLDLGLHLLDHFFQVKPPRLTNGILSQESLCMSNRLIELASLSEQGHAAHRRDAPSLRTVKWQELEDSGFQFGRLPIE